jgi:Nif-specific regulatory protein
VSATSPQPAAVADKLPALLGLTQAINARQDLPSLFRIIAQEAARLLQADRASVFLLDRDKGELWSIVTLDGKQIRFDARLGIMGAVVVSGQTINVKDAQTDPRFFAKIDTRTGFRTRSMLAVPLRNPKGEVIGTVQAMNKKRGAFTVEDVQLLQILVAHAAPALENAQTLEALVRERELLLRESSHLRKEVEGSFATQNIIGQSDSTRHVVRLIEQISDSPVTVLITGESGTGKELVAKAVHYTSRRARKEFVSLNCAAIPENLLESELFGIERNVATGVDARPGKFETAHGSTLFLDEIGDLSLTAQAKILRVLQERVVERVGARKPVPVDVRVVTATNKDLAREIERGNFRQDLFYRLKGVHIQLPPLRESREDIPALANHFLADFCKGAERPRMTLSQRALGILTRYSWPGNVRELQQEMERLVAACRKRVADEEDLSADIRQAGAVESPTLSSTGSLKAAIEELEQRMIREALESCDWNQQHAARKLKVSRQGLINKMKRYGIREG